MSLAHPTKSSSNLKLSSQLQANHCVFCNTGGRILRKRKIYAVNLQAFKLRSGHMICVCLQTLVFCCPQQFVPVGFLVSRKFLVPMHLLLEEKKNIYLLYVHA
ncbi:hypothetical protein PRUPE_1G135900 [Prunus persica]|uniref:Uncharacterized protein n=1 Tax=Prunus persica TaxID=3760 RepID=A0A251QWT4_PRUPE|nr:hypothetical protein PRUPE_1G135900 [Prunus persica]